MLLGYGIRLGAPWRVLQAVGGILVGAGADGANHTVLATGVGLALHLVVTLACGIAYVTLTRDAREHRVAWAIAIAAAVDAAAFIVARTFGGSIALALTPGNLVAIGVAIAISLPIGMRFAFSRL
jgi:hypothetical protein